MSIRQSTTKQNEQQIDSVDTWKNAIEKMTFNEIVLLEYSTKNNSTFRKMFPCAQNAYVKSARCSLCETASLTNFTALLQHIQGKKHVAKVKAVVEDYKHPTVNPFTSQGSTIETGNLETSTNKTEAGIRKTGESKIVINPVSVSAELLKQSSESTRDIIADKKALREQMSKMTLDDLLLIEYRFINTGWQKLFEENKSFMVCTMCKSSPLPHVSAMKQHLNERKHQTNTDLTKGLYHPKYAPIKDEGSRKEVSNLDNLEKHVETCATIQKDKNSETNFNSDSKENVNESKIDESTGHREKSSLDTKQEKTDGSPAVRIISPQTTPLIVTSKQRSLTNVFRTKMLALNIDDLKKIEYRYSTGSWKKMLIQNNSNQIKCMLCNLIIIQSLSDIKQHIAGKKHQLILDSVALLYHPTLANTKTEEQEVDKKFSQEDIFSDQLFRHEIPKLSLEDLKQVEYTCDNKIWKKLISVIYGTFKCILCNASNISSTHTLLEHLKGKRHADNMNSVEKFYHPTKTLKKDVENVNPSEVQSSDSMSVGHSIMEFKNPTTTSILSPQSKTTSTITKAATSTILVTKSSNTALNLEPEVSTAKLENQSETTSVRTKATSGLNTNLKSKNLTASEILEAQSEITSKSSDVASVSSISQTRSAEKSTELCFNKSEQKKESVSQSSSENTLKREGRIVCTIELEDSPEREIGKDEEKSICVINPAAVKVKDMSELNIVKSLHASIFDEQNLQLIPTMSSEHQPVPQSQVNILNPIKITSNNEQSKVLASTAQSASNIKKSQQSQKKNRDITQRVDRNKSLQTIDKKKTSFSTKVFSSKIERDVEGLIGVEYVVKILRNVNDSSPRYECCLCEVEVDGIGMQWHLKGLHHRMKFLERHFPTAMRAFSQFKDNVNMSAVMAQIADKLSVAIEKYHGRDLPYECLLEEFRSNRHGIMSKVFSFKHASERSGPSFTDIIDKKTIDEFVANRTSYKNPQPDPKRRTTFDNDSHLNKRQRLESPKLDVDEHRRLVEQFLENTNRSGGHRRLSPRRRRSKSRSPYRYNRQKRSRSPRLLGRQSRSRSRSRDYRRYSKRIHNSPTRDGDIWQIYRRQFDRSLEDLEKQYERYRKDPESHPRYDDEWRQFWSRRTDELIAEGRNPASHNFQPEWVKFFIHRINELYEEAVEHIRINLRKKLGLGLQNSELSDDRYHVGIDRTYRQNEDIVSHQQSVNELFDHVRASQQQQINMEPPQMQRIHYMQQTQHMQQMYQMPQLPPYNSYSMQHHKMQQQEQQQIQNSQESQSYSVQQSQHESNLLEVDAVETIRAPIIKGGKQQKSPLELRSRLEKKSESHLGTEFDTEEITPVSVLRILTALEDQLGSLGPKVIDLLSKALTLEKVKSNTAVESLLNAENCVFLETVCEKLKGQLLAGLAEPSKIRAVKKAIKDVSVLLNSVNEKFQNQPPEPPKPPVISNVTKSLSTKPVSSTDKRELASKLATALSAQGKTDFTTEQLEQLVTVYSMINKKARETSATSSHGGNDNQKQHQKSLSDTLADLMKSADETRKEHFNRNTTTLQNTFTSHMKFYTTDNKTSDNQSQPLTKSYDFGMLSNFDTSLKLDKPTTSASIPNLDRNLSTDMLNKILSNVSQNSKISTQNPGNFSGNRGNFDRDIGILGTTNRTEQQIQIPPLLHNLETNQMYSQHQSAFHNNYNIQGRSNLARPMISYPSNVHLNQQGRSGLRNSQDNSSRQAPMGWGGKFGYKR